MSPPNRFGTLGETYRFLLQLFPGARVGLIGRHWLPFRENFSAAGLVPDDLKGDDPPRPVDALFFEGSLRHLSSLTSQAIGPTTRLLLIVRQRNVPAGVVRGVSSLAVKKIGIPIVADFTPVPDFDNADAFVAPGVDPSPWAMKRSLLRRLVPRWDNRPSTHLLFMAESVHATGFGKAAALLTQATGDEGATIERYHPRRWGPLIFVLVTPTGERRVLRITTNPHVATRVLRNLKCTSGLLGYPGMPAEVARLIPAPIGSEVDDGAGIRAFAEEFRPGQMAWTLYRDESRRRRIDDELLAFSHGMQRATRTTPEQGGQHSTAVLATVFPNPATRAASAPAVQRVYDALERMAAAGLDVRRLPRCLGHGDYGVGNALAVDSGAITAIIDWDQHVEADLPGMDWCSHRLRSEHWRRGMIDALEDLVASSRRTGFLAPSAGTFGQVDFGMTPEDLQFVACLAALRSLARSGRFLADLRSSAPHCAGTLGTVARHLAAVSPNT